MAFGRLERSSVSQPLSEINVTPLIDVMLVLLVIFIITAPLMVSAVKVELPQAQGAQSLNAPKFLSISMTSSGQTYLDEQALDKPALAEALNVAARRNSQTEVRLRADASVPYGRVVEVMGLAQQAGLSRIGFVATPEPVARPVPQASP
jgi:biopolymer transport protein TolR